MKNHKRHTKKRKTKHTAHVKKQTMKQSTNSYPMPMMTDSEINKMSRKELITMMRHVAKAWQKRTTRQHGFLQNDENTYTTAEIRQQLKDHNEKRMRDAWEQY
jgi:hypothetical protein